MSGIAAAFFDLDKTLVSVNTGPRYVEWRVRRRELTPFDMLRVSYWGLQYTFGLLDADAASRRAALTLVGRPEDSFRTECAGWVRREVVRHISDAARAEVERQKSLGRPCVILTTSSPYVADPVAEHLGIEHVLASRCVVRDGRFTGELIEPLCFGAGKVEHASRWADDHGVDLADSVFFTDSVTDLPMLERVREPRVINPDPRLERTARRRGWPIERWRTHR